MAAAGADRRRDWSSCWLLPADVVPADPLTVRNIRVVQPNIGQEDKWRPGFDEEAARRLALLSGRPGEAKPAAVAGSRGHRSAGGRPGRRCAGLRGVPADAGGLAARPE